MFRSFLHVKIFFSYRGFGTIQLGSFWRLTLVTLIQNTAFHQLFL